MARLESTWKVQCSREEPHTIIQVTGLQTSLTAATDVWGRHPVSQPVLISCTVSLWKPFVSASTEDAVTKSTVHYGTLSKALLAACDRYSKKKISQSKQMSQLIHYIQCWLTGVNLINESSADLPSRPVLHSAPVEFLALEIVLPKASLLGSGVKIRGAFRYNEDSTMITLYSIMLELCDLRIPTLIGVNPNERLAKQMVIVTVQIDHFDQIPEKFHDLEQVTVKSVEESSFRTLEALGQRVGERVVKFFLHPDMTASQKTSNPPVVRIRMSKPAAVTLADFPTIEMLIEPGKIQ